MLARAHHLLERFRDRFPLPAELFHYTSGEGLHGILQSGHLRGFNFSFMNDRSEMTYGFQLLRSLVEERVKHATEPLERKFCEALLTTAVPAGIDVYLTCFCEVDDLLSQWRGYGAPDARYCISFNAAELRGTRADVSDIIHVVYDPLEQRDVLEFVFNEHLSTLRASYSANMAAGADPLCDAVECLYNCSLIPLAFFKHPSFRDEHEWRCAAIAQPAEFNQCIDFVSASGIVKPYLPLLRGVDGRLPVRHVTAGASRSPAQAEKGAALILARYEYFNIEVRPSQVPLAG